MTVTEESEGRLNAFAKEPKMQVIDKDASQNRGSWIFTIFGIVLVIGLIAFSLTIN